MYTQDEPDLKDVPTGWQPDKSRRSQRTPWLAGIGTLIVVALLVGLSVVLFTQRRASTSGSSVPPVGQWTQSLNGYSIASLVAAPSNPAVLYACANAFTPSTGSSGSSGGAPGSTSSTGTTGNGGSSTDGKPVVPPANVIALLRSTDYGTHWQDIGAKANLHAMCLLTVDPAHSDSIYVLDEPAVVSNTGNPIIVLKYSVDGGNTWSVITPSWDGTIKGLQVSWNIQDLQMVNGRLYGIQWVDSPAKDTTTSMTISAHMAESTDGGHTWTLLKNDFGNVDGVMRYVVDPSNADTIYAVVGSRYFGGAEQGKVPTRNNSMAQQLYKTTNNGKSWQLLLKDLYYGSQVQIASANPSIIYAGGMPGIMPLAAQESANASKAPNATDVAQSNNGFRLYVSTNAGKSWNMVIVPDNVFPTQQWLVDSNGQLYIAVSSTGSVVPGNSVPATKASPPSTIQPAGSAPKVGAPSQGVATNVAPPDQNASAKVETTPSTTTSMTHIYWYNPTTHAWNSSLQTSIYGNLIAVTPTSVAGQVVVWLAVYTEAQQGLARYIVK